MALSISPAADYITTLWAAKHSNPSAYWSVDAPTLADAEAGTLISTGHGFALVSLDGDIKGLFKLPNSKASRVADSLLFAAVLSGGRKLDNFDTYLTKVYLRAGFRIAARTKFNPEFAPNGWDPAKHGYPDVVAMIYDPCQAISIVETVCDTYDEMISVRDALMDKCMY
jgi:hypothetical protein